MDPVSLTLAGTAAASAAGGTAATGMAAAGIGATIAGGFMAAAGDLFGGQAQGKMAEYQAGLATQRSEIAAQNARYAIQTGESEALTSGIRTGQTVGLQKAGQGAGNIDTTTGSGARVRASQTEVGQMSEGNIRTTAARRAYGYGVQAAEENAQANVYSTQSATAREASYIGAGSSILGAAGSVASKWSQASLAGIGGSGVATVYPDPNNPGGWAPGYA